jgi:acetylornithine deacetylase/succinyl-diaminopimelate desuccinylase-like protein
VLLRSGGTIPVINTLQETLGVPVMLMGFALPDDRMHAPNEKFHLPNFYRGISTNIWFLAEAARRLRRADEPTRKHVRHRAGASLSNARRSSPV